MATVTTNDKILNALNLYNKNLQKKLSDEYVAQVEGKDLSTNDFSDAYKDKLDGVNTDTYVIKIEGKGLSTNDFTYADKEKLDNVATDTYVTKVAGKGLSTNDFTNELKNKLVNIDPDADLSQYVKKEEGKGLSSNDFTTELKDKLDSVATDTYVLKETGKSLSTNDFTNAYKTALDELDDNFAKKSDIGRVFKNKGSVEKFENLPTENNSDGYVYNIRKKGGTDRHGVAIKAGDNVVYVVEEDPNLSGWDVLSGAVDLSNYVEKDGEKVLSTNDFTDELKDKLDSVATDTYVLKETGKGLSSNDFTTAEKNKLGDIESNAQKNIIEKIKVNGNFAEIDSDTKVASITVQSGGGGGLQFVISSVQPEGTNILWLDTSKYEN